MSKGFSVIYDCLGLANLVAVERKIRGSRFGMHFEVLRKRMNSLESDARSRMPSGSRTGSEGYGSLPLEFVTSVPFLPPTSQAALDGLNYLDPVRATNKRCVGNSLPAQPKNGNANASKVSVCVLCRNNGESREYFSSHMLEGNEGNTTCPILRAYTCALYKASGDQSHTIKYCPKYTPKTASVTSICFRI